jgi:hypothetical protein
MEFYNDFKYIKQSWWEGLIQKKNLSPPARTTVELLYIEPYVICQNIKFLS